MIPVEVYEHIKDIPSIEELRHQTKRRYDVVTRAEVLDEIIRKHDVIIISGGYFGDEGKGKITSAIVEHPDVVLSLRLNSGENAGHTVVINGEKYVLHLLPSGILVPGKIAGIGAECVMDPVSFMEKEVSQLVRGGVDYKDRLFVGNVSIVGPHHKILDFALSTANSSTLMGMSYVHASKVMKKVLRLDDIFNSEDAQRKVLAKDLEIYRALLKERGKEEEYISDELEKLVNSGERKIPQHLFDFLRTRSKIDYLVHLYKEKVKDNPEFPRRANVTQMLRDTLRKGKKAAIESAQSAKLSSGIEQHANSGTAAQTHAFGTAASGDYDISNHLTVVINVLKTPGDSRVGIGANVSSFVPQDYFSSRGINSLGQMNADAIDFDEVQRKFYEAIQKNGILKPFELTDKAGNKYWIDVAMAIATAQQFGERGSTTNKPRITGTHDCLSDRFIVELQGHHTVISAMDRGDYQDYVGLTVGHIYHNPTGESSDSNGTVYRNGHIIRIGDPQPGEHVQKHCHPIIKVMKGWKDTPIGVGKRKLDDPLPETVQDFIGTLEDLAGSNTIAIGNGPDTKNLIFIKQRQ